MSEDAPVFGEQSEPQVISTINKEPPRGNDKANAIQIETIRELDEIISDIIAEKSSVHDGCWFLTTTLDENPSLTAEQCSETYRIYRGSLKEAYTTWMWAIAQGKHEPNHTPSRADPPGENGPQEPDTDDEAGPPIENLPMPNPSDIFTLRPRHEGWGPMLKHTSDDEGSGCRDYAWNWEKPRGGPPWQDVEEATLSVAQKTHFLQNTYVINIKWVLQSLESQQNHPDSPPILWWDVLANWQIDLTVLVEDWFSRVTAYNEVIDLGDNFELSTKRARKSKTKITSDLDWFYTWMKYSAGVLWAYP